MNHLPLVGGPDSARRPPAASAADRQHQPGTQDRYLAKPRPALPPAKPPESESGRLQAKLVRTAFGGAALSASALGLAALIGGTGGLAAIPLAAWALAAALGAGAGLAGGGIHEAITRNVGAKTPPVLLPQPSSTAPEEPGPNTYAAIDHILDGNENGLLKSVLADFTPATDGQKSPGLSAKTVLKGLSFALRNPRRTANLIGLYRSGAYASPEFQKKLITSDKLWNAIDTAAQQPETLPRIFRAIGAAIEPDPSRAPAAASEPSSDQGAAISPDVIAALRASPRLRTFLAAHKTQLTSEVSKLAAKQPVEGYLKQFGVKNKALDLVPWALTHVDEVMAIVDDFANKDPATGAPKPFMNTLEGILFIIASDPDLRKFFEAHPDVAISVTDAYLNQYPDWSDTLGLRSGVMRLIKPLLADPTMAHIAVAAVNRQDYMVLTEILIKELNRPESRLLSSMTEPETKQAFENLATDLATHNPDIGRAMATYGIDTAKIPGIVSIIDALLDRPADLKTIFDSLRQKKYLTMVKDIITASKNNPKLKAWLRDNESLISTVAKKATAGMSTYGVDPATAAKFVVDNIVNSPDQIIGLIHAYETGSLGTFVGNSGLLLRAFATVAPGLANAALARVTRVFRDT